MAKKDDKTSTISKLSAKIDQMSSRSAQLKEEVAGLNKALADLAAATAEMDQMRQQEHKDFVKNKAEMQQGLVRQAHKQSHTKLYKHPDCTVLSVSVSSPMGGLPDWGPIKQFDLEVLSPSPLQCGRG